LNQYTAVNSVTYNYDNNSNLTGDGTNTSGYDVESRLISLSKSGTTAAYTYDAFNRRVSKTVNGTTIYYVYDGDDIIEERSSAGALNADWVHGDNIDEPLTMTRAGTTYYYFTDALGSVRELTNSAGVVQETYTYNSYGQLAAAPTINNPFTFTGREYDPESGNFYYRARHYSPTLGRFLQRDPLGYEDSMNLFEYTWNSPTNWVDPYGLTVLEVGPINISPNGTNITVGNSGNSDSNDFDLDLTPQNLTPPPIGNDNSGNGGGFLPGEIGPRFPRPCPDGKDNGDLRSNNKDDQSKRRRDRSKKEDDNEKKNRRKTISDHWKKYRNPRDWREKNDMRKQLRKMIREWRKRFGRS
jgi:RHS repeat-associated protein